MTTLAPENLLGYEVSPSPPYEEVKPRTLAVLLFCSLILGHRILEMRGLSDGTLDLALCIGTSLVGFIWPIGAVVGVLGSIMIGEATAPLGASLSLWLRTALALRLAFDILVRRFPLSRITSSTYRYWLPFAAVVLLSYLASGSDAGTAWLLKFVLTSVFVAGCAAYVQGLDSLLTLQTGLVATGLVSAVWGVVSFAGGGLRTGGLEASTNYGAMYMCTAFFLALGLVNGKGLSRVLAIAAAICIPLGILASGSRGGGLLMLIGTVVYVFLFQRSAGRLFRVVGLSAVIGILVLGFAPELFRNSRFLHALPSFLRGSTVNLETGGEWNRLPLWRDSIRLWLSHPILGVGPANWVVARTGIRETGSTVAPHMYIGQILAELGTLGGLAYLYFLLRSFRAAARRLGQDLQPRSELLTSWAVAGLTLAASTFSGYAYNPFLHAFIIIATSSALLWTRSHAASEAESTEISEPENGEPVC